MLKQKNKQKPEQIQAYKKAEEKAGKDAVTQYKKLEKVKEKILDLTKQSVDKIAEGITKIREQTERAIEKIKNTFFSGGAILSLAKVGKGLENEDVRSIFQQLKTRYNERDLNT